MDRVKYIPLLVKQVCANNYPMAIMHNCEKKLEKTKPGRKQKKDIKHSEYIFNDFELEKFRKNKDNKIISIQRYKGLGEMDAEQLWETTLNPESRILAQVSISDTVEADDITTTLMSSNVPPRRQFIMEEAKYATLDI